MVFVAFAMFSTSSRKIYRISLREYQTDLKLSNMRSIEARFMAIVDALNAIFGRGTLVFAVQGLTHAWRMRQDWRSLRFTKRWDELLTI